MALWRKDFDVVERTCFGDGKVSICGAGFVTHHLWRRHYTSYTTQQRALDQMMILFESVTILNASRHSGLRDCNKSQFGLCSTPKLSENFSEASRQSILQAHKRLDCGLQQCEHECRLISALLFSRSLNIKVLTFGYTAVPWRRGVKT